MAGSIRDLFRAGSDAGFSLEAVATTPAKGVGRNKAERETERDKERLARWQEKLSAEGTRSLLIVLQGMDASGKDGTIKHVIGSMNPQGCYVTAFKAPTEAELSHNFLWRIRKGIPKPGCVGVFNRSHYEDVVIARVDHLVPDEVWRSRFATINRFEKGLVARGTTIVKIFLHISLEEQRLRLLKRIHRPDKRWKFEKGDIDKRDQWNDYMVAYTDAMRRCTSVSAPWYVVPADSKWYRNWAIGRIVVETFAEMDPRHPQPEIDVEAFTARLEQAIPSSSSR